MSVANASGTAIAIDSYDEYGVPGAGNVGRFQYTGQAWLPALGLYYYKARMYAPRLGRFLQTDPIGYADQNNLYAYVGNSPIGARDASGLIGQTCESSDNCYISGGPDVEKAPARRKSPVYIGGPEAGRSVFGSNRHIIEGDPHQDVVAQFRGGYYDARYHYHDFAWEAALFSLGVSAAAGSGAIAAGFEAAAVAEETTTLYRVVGPDELADIGASGGYRGSPGGLESKYFYPSQSQAVRFATNPANARFGPFTMTSTEVPNSVLQGADIIRVAGEGNVITIPNNSLPNVPAPTIWNYSPVPGVSP